MAVCDPVADMLARLRNAHQGLHAQAKVPVSKVKADIARILKEEGYIADYEVGERDMVVTLKYVGGKPVISGSKKISTPGRRVYVGVGEVPRVQNGLGICVLSTSKGIMSGERAQTEKVGGELLCEIW